MRRARQRNVSIREKNTKTIKPVNKKKKVKNMKRRRIIFFSVIIAIVAVFVALGFGGAGNNALFPVDTSTGKMNVLMLGVDQDGLRTDAIMVASYDFDDESLKLLSIPRDTKVYVENRKVTRKINEVHAMTKKNGDIMGPMASIEAVTALTGLPIHYYVEFSFDAIDHVMDILGPVTYDVPDVEGNGRGMNYDDPTQDLHIHLKPGLQELSGNQVQQFLRYRKSNNGSSDGSDTSRVERQHGFVKALIEQKVNMALVVKAPEIFSQIKKEIKTNFSGGEVAKYATHLLKLTSEKISTYSLPGENKHQKAWYFVCDLEATEQLIETEFGYDVDGLTNKMNITGEKVNVAKVKKAEKEDEEETKKPEKTSKPEKDEEEDEEEEEEETPTPEPSPEETKEPEEEEKTPYPTKKPTQQPTKKPTAEPTEKATEKPADKSTDKPTEKPTDKPAEKPESDSDEQNETSGLVSKPQATADEASKKEEDE